MHAPGSPFLSPILRKTSDFHSTLLEMVTYSSVLKLNLIETYFPV